jgi:preprotein translocase subunit SecF
MRRKTFPEIVNASINQTLSRTLLTSLTTLIVVLCLLLLGGQVINNFAFALLVGVITGTYSSIFVASPILAFWQKVIDKRSRPGR